MKSGFFNIVFRELNIFVLISIGLVILFNGNLHEVDENGEVVLHYIDPDALCNESA